MHRHSRSIALEPALIELMRLYDRAGGPTASAAAEIETAIEHSLGGRQASRENLHTRLQLLLRARDLHHYVMEAPALVSLKVRLCEHLLQHRELAQRWAAVRELLLAHLDLICETPYAGLTANVEFHKYALSDRSSPLGRLLVTVALFNLDLEGALPPANLMLRFRRHRFPQHWWELCGDGAGASQPPELGNWSPSQPLCRWEYLAADLACAIQGRSRAPGRAAASTPPAAGTAGAPGPEPQAIYGRFDADAAGDAPAQLDLFPLDADSLLAGLLRHVHRRQGPEGIRLLAALCGRLEHHAPGSALALSLSEVAAGAAQSDLTARTLRQRTERLVRVVGELERVELTRVVQVDGTMRAQTGRLLTVLGRSADWSVQHTAPVTDQGEMAWTLLLDPWAHDALAQACRGLPGLLLECAGKPHPCLLPLYLWVRRAWAAGTAGSPLERSARALLDEAGIWVSETGRYRALEALRRDLEFMRECGWLGSWRLRRSESRDAMEDSYRLTAPGPTRPTLHPLAVHAGVEDGWEALTGS